MGSIVYNAIKRLNYFGHPLRLLGVQENITWLIIISAIFGGLLAPIFDPDFASATSDEGADTGGGEFFKINKMEAEKISIYSKITLDDLGL